MDIVQARQRADFVVWIGGSTLHILHRKDRTKGLIELPPMEGVPYIPHFHGLWEEASQNSFRQLAQALGGRLRVRMGCILAAIPDDTTWIERKALEEFFIMAGSGATNKRLFLCPQSTLLRPPGETFAAVTWSCRCFSVCLVKNGSVSNRVYLDAARCSPEGLSATVRQVCSGESLPVYYPDWETTPMAIRAGTGVPFDTLALPTH